MELVQDHIKLRRDNLVKENVPSRESPAGTCKGKAKEIEKIYEVLSIRGHTSRGKCGVKMTLSIVVCKFFTFFAIFSIFKDL